MRLEGYRFNENQKEGSLTLKYYVKEAEVTCQIYIPRRGELSYWRISIKNGSAFDIVEVTFPLLLGLRIGRNHQDDILVRPNRYGEKIPNPVEKPFTIQINLNEYSLREIEEVTQHTLESTRRLRFNVDRRCLKIYVDGLNESFPLSAITVKAKNQR